jgi:hypothetical protein
MTVMRTQLLRVAGTTVLLLLVPLVAMQFTSEVNWLPEDFVAAALLLGSAGVAMVLALRWFATRRAKVIAVATIAVVLLLVWAELAVGLFD